MNFVLHAPRGCGAPRNWFTSRAMAGRDPQSPEWNQGSSDVRLAALRAELQRDVDDADVKDVLTALVDALDFQRRKPLRMPG